MNKDFRFISRRRLKVFRASVFVLLCLFVLPVNAIEYGGFGGKPALPREDNPRSESIFIHVLEPGEIKEEAVWVANNTPAEKTLMVYPADSTPSSDGAFACEQLSQTKDGVGAWIKLSQPVEPSLFEELNLDYDLEISTTTSSTEEVTEEEEEDALLDTDEDGLPDKLEIELGTSPDKADTDNDDINDKDEIDERSDPFSPLTLTLQSGERVAVPFTITVPEEIDVGEHDGCILIQEKKGDSNTPGISLSTRAGLRVAITIPGEIIEGLQIVSFTVSNRQQGGKILKPTVLNNGNVSVDADIQVTTKNIFGQIVKEHGGVYPILRGDTSSWNFELAPSFWGGPHVSQVVIDYENGRLESEEVWFWLMPETAGLIAEIAILVLLLGILLVLFLKGRRKRWISKNWKRYKVKPSDDIKELARKHGVSWRMLAKANDLKAPYTLKRGSSIIVPPGKTKTVKKTSTKKKTRKKKS